MLKFTTNGINYSVHVSRKTTGKTKEITAICRTLKKGFSIKARVDNINNSIIIIRNKMDSVIVSHLARSHVK